MEFHEKLQKLRTGENLTQEELAAKLYVSRTAISKWESGRGYPSVDSLKNIAKFFHVTVDELLCGEEMLGLAEQEIKKTGRKTTALVCGLLDCLAVLLLFLPVFGDGGASVALTALSGVGEWLKIVFIAAVGLAAANGLAAVAVCGFDRPLWDRHRLVTGMALSVAGTMLFLAAKQPYAGAFFFTLLVVKGFLLLKNR